MPRTARPRHKKPNPALRMPRAPAQRQQNQQNRHLERRARKIPLPPELQPNGRHRRFPAEPIHPGGRLGAKIPLPLGPPAQKVPKINSIQTGIGPSQ